MQEDRDDERHPHEQKPLHVLRDQGEVASAVPEQPRREERLLSSSLPHADVEEEADQEPKSESEEHHEQHVVGTGLQDPEYNEEHADRRQKRPNGVEGPCRVGWERIVQATAQDNDRPDDQSLKDKRGPPTDAGRDHAPYQRAGRGADPSEAANRTKCPGPRGEIAEPQRCEDVDRRDQQRSTNAL